MCVRLRRAGREILFRACSDPRVRVCVRIWVYGRVWVRVRVRVRVRIRGQG